MDNTSRKNPSNTINNFLNWNIHLRIQNSNWEFKYQFLDQIIFLKLNKKNSELKCQFSDSNYNIQH